MKKPAKEPSRGQASLWTQLLIPLAALVRGDLLALVHQLGMQARRRDARSRTGTKLCGERYKHDASRRATRYPASSSRGYTSSPSAEQRVDNRMTTAPDPSEPDAAFTNEPK
ncbi:MAG: hypothetical protein KIT84_10950 [Labilithrix sp.]|nr:hypothetical protein [Labilithrix sp.]MCW5811525.1 hypothetical protein [Labilithrix sp.]